MMLFTALVILCIGAGSSGWGAQARLVSSTKLPSVVLPSNTDRNWMCPNRMATVPPDYLPSPDVPSHAVVHSDLAAVVPEAALMNNSAVILVKRDSHGRPYFKYWGNGFQDVACETWSCSKIFSAMNGAGHMGEVCGTANGNLADWTTGDYGNTPLGDLVTIIVTYDTTHPPYSSNALGGWFERVGGRDRAGRLVQRWLNQSNETLGANYGADPPTDLVFDFHPKACNITPDSEANDGHSNTLSALTMAEMVKRIVTARELPHLAFPNTSWVDSQNLLYGASPSLLFPGRVWGGMSAIGDNLMQAGLNMTDIEEVSKGMWRTFSKDGGGYSFIRLAGEATYNGYACFPDAANPEKGVEYIVSGRVSIPGDRHAIQAYSNIRTAIAAINAAVVSGKLR